MIVFGKDIYTQVQEGSRVNRKVHSPQNNKKATKKPQTETKQKNKVNKIEAREWEGNLVRSKVSSLELNCSILQQN